MKPGLLQKNEIYDAVIDNYTSDGDGVCRIKDCVVFVPGTIVGERWKIKILKATADFSYGKAIECIESSPERVKPECGIYSKCGGCTLQHMSYKEELAFKLGRVNAALTRIGKQSLLAEYIEPSAEMQRYRNKGIYDFTQTEGGPECGFYRARSHDVIPAEECLIQNEITDRAAAAVLEFLKLNAIPAYNEKNGKGTVRHVFCRRAVNTSDAVVCIISAKGFGSLTEILVDYLRQKCPQLTGIVLNINKTKGNSVLAGNFYTLWGRDSINDTLCGLKFQISPRSFYQINPHQAEKLYQEAVSYATSDGEKTIIDLYCGTGTISLCLAQKAQYVIGAEIVPEAIENAKTNAENNRITNVEFICADAGQAAAELQKRHIVPDSIVVDPPRKGMDANTISVIASMKPGKIVYVSCNPATLARDIELLNHEGFILKKIKSFDMFPRTSHVETVALLSRM